MVVEGREDDRRFPFDDEEDEDEDEDEEDERKADGREKARDGWACETVMVDIEGGEWVWYEFGLMDRLYDDARWFGMVGRDGWWVLMAMKGPSYIGQVKMSRGLRHKGRTLSETGSVKRLSARCAVGSA